MKENAKKCRTYCNELTQKIIHYLALIFLFALTLKVIKAIKVCIFYLLCWPKTGNMSSSTQQSCASFDNLVYIHTLILHEGNENTAG